jgi:hypothetical protein
MINPYFVQEKIIKKLKISPKYTQKLPKWVQVGNLGRSFEWCDQNYSNFNGYRDVAQKSMSK